MEKSNLLFLCGLGKAFRPHSSNGGSTQIPMISAHNVTAAMETAIIPASLFPIAGIGTSAATVVTEPAMSGPQSNFSEERASLNFLHFFIFSEQSRIASTALPTPAEIPASTIRFSVSPDTHKTAAETRQTTGTESPQNIPV